MTEEKINYLRFATESEKSKMALFKLAMDRRYFINNLVEENEQLKQIIKTACKDEEFVCDLLTTEQYELCKKMGLCK